MSAASGGTAECRLLQGIAALIAQLVLAVISFSALYIKRLRERPQRPKNIWALDVSKQVIGMGAAHASGLLIAILVHEVTSSASACSWYLIAFTFDTSVGVAFTMLLHKCILTYLQQTKSISDDFSSNELNEMELSGGGARTPGPAEASWQTAVLACGSYGDPPSLQRWAFQAGEWAACVVVARALCGGLVVLVSSLLRDFAAGVDELFEGHPTLLLFTVMVCCPLLMNATQLLIQDAVLKGRQRGRSAERGSALVLPETEQVQLLDKR